ncbi:MAG: DNA replication and repair protein RecF [Dysgonamonadaceae bacterium]|jgi:DNA replication and repair protein RecF|nr:DNA replication and repair protein RecF [Dysgonamonadaceae bacterium]
MIIEKISILNFKNIAQADLRFSPKINCLFGNNGMGKTNLLDALYYLSFCRNHTNLPDSQLIMHGRDFAVLQACYRFEDQTEDIYCGIRYRQRKILKRNKKEYERLSEHIGLLPLVMISPADSDLIHGGSEGRRRFIDVVISQFDKAYLQALIKYNKALLQRNSLLKDASLPDQSLFEIWEEQLSTHGQMIHQKRNAFVAEFLPIFRQFHQTICQEGDAVGLQYESQLNHKELRGMLSAERQRDRLLGYTSCGIHKDDFYFMLDDYLIRKIGSQGQNKTCLIALKLAQFYFLVKTGASVPILILDDVFDKLDSRRVEQIVGLVSQSQFGQIFITDTNRKYLDEIITAMHHDYKLFQVENGRFDEIENKA